MFLCRIVGSRHPVEIFYRLMKETSKAKRITTQAQWYTTTLFNQYLMELKKK